jgi:hypothetical protein
MATFPGCDIQYELYFKGKKVGFFFFFLERKKLNKLECFDNELEFDATVRKFQCIFFSSVSF